jgi:N6-adenosine-specific RNA methylase IME4
VSLKAVKDFATEFEGREFGTILADPPWRFANRTGKMAPEHHRLSRYGTMDLEEIKALPVVEVAAKPSHLYLWVPNALLRVGFETHADRANRRIMSMAAAA